MKFKNFLLNENQVHFNQKSGDILNALQDLQQNSHSMGTRELIKDSERIVNQIRTILHSNWSKKEEEMLKLLQKIGVAIMRAIESKDDLKEIINSAKSELEKGMGDKETPLHTIGAPADAEYPKENPEN